MPNVDQRIGEIRQTVSRTGPFLQARINAERSARQLLDARAGSFTTEDLCRFLDLCNTELVPPKVSDEFRAVETRTRFQLAFVGQNRCLMLRTLDECNRWIALLWKDRNDELGTLDSFWRSSRIKGASTGLPTMLLYLKHPETYSVWLGFLSEALSSIMGQQLPTARTVHSYLRSTKRWTRTFESVLLCNLRKSTTFCIDSWPKAHSREMSNRGVCPNRHSAQRGCVRPFLLARDVLAAMEEGPD